MVEEILGHLAPEHARKPEQAESGWGLCFRAFGVWGFGFFWGLGFRAFGVWGFKVFWRFRV